MRAEMLTELRMYNPARPTEASTQVKVIVLLMVMMLLELAGAYLIFVIFFTLAKFLENKIYTEKRQFFALNL